VQVWEKSSWKEAQSPQSLYCNPSLTFPSVTTLFCPVLSFICYLFFLNLFLPIPPSFLPSILITAPRGLRGLQLHIHPNFFFPIQREHKTERVYRSLDDSALRFTIMTISQ